MIESQHTDFKVTTTGIHVNATYLFLGASPDGLVECTCHGQGLVEIKCPYSYEKGLDGWKGALRSPVTVNGEMVNTHQYYYQIQQQMLVTKRLYCDFFVWTKGTNSTTIIRHFELKLNNIDDSGRWFVDYFAVYLL